jgi:phosphohistidine phosphatase
VANPRHQETTSRGALQRSIIIIKAAPEKWWNPDMQSAAGQTPGSQALYILRHAKAVTWTPSADDFSRELQPVGLKHARSVAGWIVQQGALPDCILCSPSQRTRETLAPLLSMKPQLESVTNFLPQLYHANQRTLQAALDAAFAEANRVLLVGHNPGLEVLAGELTHRRHHPEFDRLPTGTLVVVEFAGGWANDEGKGTLGAVIRGRNLSAD